MKQAIIYYGGFIRFGGVYSHVKTIKSELELAGWMVDSITLDRLPIYFRYLPHLVEKLVNFFDHPMGYFFKGLITRGLYKIYFNRTAELIIFEDIYISWNSNIPSITMLHAVWSDNLQSKQVSSKQMDRLKAREACLIESISHTVATVSTPYLDYLQRSHFQHLLSKKIDVIELGVDQSKFKLATDRNKKSIIYVGALEARKNCMHLLKVFDAICKTTPDYILTLVGDGPQKGQLVDYAETNNLKVRFLGALSHDAVIAELPQHGIYLHTSIKESFSYALLEAKLSGLQTCAYCKLQVPAEFIDVPVNSFEVSEWRNAILKMDAVPKSFDANNFTSNNMMQKSIELAR